MPITIKDVAQLAGVSPSTVSRVLAGSSRISDDTHRKVRAAMKELRYHPHAIARSLARKSTRTLGLIIARPAEQAFANPFFPEVIRGIGSVIQKAGFSLILFTTENEKEERASCLQMLRGRTVDGVILTSSRIQDRLIGDLVTEGHSFVLIGRPTDPNGVTWVNNDNQAVGAMAVEHLASIGHREIALINGPKNLVVCQDRLEGYRTALTKLGLNYREELVVSAEFTQESGYHSMELLLSRSPAPTAVFCADDVMAIGAMKCLQDRDLRIPEDIAVMGVNDDVIGAYLTPSLTTIRIPIFDLGATAAGLLLDLVTGQAAGPKQVVLPSRLIPRGSTRPGTGAEPPR